MTDSHFQYSFYYRCDEIIFFYFWERAQRFCRESFLFFFLEEKKTKKTLLFPLAYNYSKYKA